VMMRVYLAVEEYYARRRRLTERRLGERDVIGRRSELACGWIAYLGRDPTRGGDAAVGGWHEKTWRFHLAAAQVRQTAPMTSLSPRRRSVRRRRRA
jgi:hypothetical protein